MTGMNSQNRIRYMTDEDVGDVCRIDAASFAKPWQQEEFIKAVHREDTIYLVATVSGSQISPNILWIMVFHGRCGSMPYCRSTGAAFPRYCDTIIRYGNNRVRTSWCETYSIGGAGFQYSSNTLLSSNGFCADRNKKEILFAAERGCAAIRTSNHKQLIC